MKKALTHLYRKAISSADILIVIRPDKLILIEIKLQHAQMLPV